MNNSRLVAPFSDCLTRCERNKTEPDQFQEVYTLVFMTSAIVATVAEAENGSNFRETCLATEVQKSFTKPTMLN